MHHPARRVNILGIGVSAINLAVATALIDTWIAEWADERGGTAARYVCCADVHSIMQGYRDLLLRGVYHRATLITPDGMPLVWLCQHAGERNAGRVYGPDLMLAVAERGSNRGYRHFFYGATSEVLDKLAAALRVRFPEMQVAGMVAPPFRPLTPEEDAAIIEQINNSRADVVWVGLGAPKQDLWMATHAGKLRVPVLIGVGAAFDFHAGVKPQAPRWMQRRGFEWAFRVMTEPRRLWRRYAFNIPPFVWLTALQWLGLRRFPLLDAEGGLPGNRRR
jgi:N-acetylglucosaminyldiphosphoundecaprenol N-acetyl-beta-D-mannosaminyltransferase